MKIISGIFKKRKAVLGWLTRHRLPLGQRDTAILVAERPAWTDFGYAGLITTTSKFGSIFQPPRFLAENANDFPEGDVVMLKDCQAHFLWETGCWNNSLLLTEACNCRCLMCPQPPLPLKAIDAKQFQMAFNILGLSPEGFEGEICLTGGEPTLCGEKLFELLVACHHRHPKAGLIMSSWATASVAGSKPARLPSRKRTVLRMRR